MKAAQSGCVRPAIASNTASTLRVFASSANSRSSICSRLCASDERSSLFSASFRKELAGYTALDVFRREPLPADSPLRSAPNCLLFPHSSAIAPDYLDLALGEFAARSKEALRHV